MYRLYTFFVSLFLTLYFWSLSVFALIFTYSVCLFISPFVDSKTISRTYETLTGKFLLYAMTAPGFWTLTVKDNRRDKSWSYYDADAEEQERQYVIIANHMSFIDSLISVVIPLKKKYMVARAFTKFPVFSWLTLNSGYVLAERGNPEVNGQAVDKAIEAMQDGSSFLLFPQGRRVEKVENLETFKTGAYRIAQRQGVAILPLTYKNTHIAMPLGGWVYPADIEIIIDEPFYVETDNYEEYIVKSQDIMRKNLVK